MLRVIYKVRHHVGLELEGDRHNCFVLFSVSNERLETRARPFLLREPLLWLH